MKNSNRALLAAIDIMVISDCVVQAHMPRRFKASMNTWSVPSPLSCDQGIQGGADCLVNTMKPKMEGLRTV